MKKIRCLIADDELLSRQVLESYVAQLDNYQLIAACRNGIEVFNILKSEPVDLLFLDIEMPQLTGLELVRSLKNNPPIIFTTAFRDYAVEGYEHNTVDYLLKPISFDRFLKAIVKFESTALPISRRSRPVPEVASSLPHAFLYIKSAKKTVKVFLRDILYLEAAKEFVRIKTVHDEIITYQTLQEFEQRLPESGFLRIHRSIIIAVDRIRACSTTHVEVDDRELPIGHSYQRSVRDALDLPSDRQKPKNLPKKG